jgi:hypothetical protein
MPVAWEEFEAVEEPKSQVDWTEFEPLSGPISPDENLIIRPPQDSTVSTTAGGPRVPVASFRETMAEPKMVGEAMEERLWEPSIPLPRFPTVAESPPSSIEKFAASAAGLGAAGIIGPNAPAALLRGAGNLAIGLPEFVSSPGGAALAILGPVAAGAGKAGQIINRLIAGGFSVDMLKSLYEQGKQTYENWDRMTPDEKAVAFEDMAGTLGLAGVTGAHFLRGSRPPPTPPLIPPPKIAPPLLTDVANQARSQGLTKAAAEVESVEPAAPAAQPEVTDATIREQSTTPVSLEPTPGDRQAVDQGVREAEQKPSPAQASEEAPAKAPAALTPQQMAEQVGAKFDGVQPPAVPGGLDHWQFTLVYNGQGITFYVPKGATMEQLQAKIEAKKAEFSKGPMTPEQLEAEIKAAQAKAKPPEPAKLGTVERPGSIRANRLAPRPDAVQAHG